MHGQKAELVVETGHALGVESVAFSPDGRILASGSGDCTVKLWDLTSGRELRTLAGHVGPVKAVAFNRDGRILASGSSDHTVKLWDVASGQELHTLAHLLRVNSVAFSPDGHILATGSLDRTIKLWDVSSGTEVHTLEDTGSVFSVAFSPDGRTLASGGQDKTAKIWDVASGRASRILAGHTGSVKSVAFSPDGRTLVSVSLNDAIKVWDVVSGSELSSFAGPEGEMVSVAFSSDGRTLASAGSDGRMKIWDVTKGSLLQTIADGSTGPIWSLAFSPDGRSLALGSDDKTIKIWDIASWHELLTLARRSSDIWSMALSPDGRTLALGSSDKTVKLWDFTGQRELRTLTGHSRDVRAVAFSPDGRTLASGSWDKTIRLWDVATGRELHTLLGHTDGVRSVAVSPDGRILASGSDTTVKLWDLASGRQLYTLDDNSKNTTSSVAFSPDGHTLASGSRDTTIKLWEVASGRDLIPIQKNNSHGIYSIAFSPDGRTLASAGTDKTIEIWDVITRSELRTLEGHAAFTLSVAYSPDGRTLASGSADGTVKLWDVARGHELRTLPVHGGWVTSIAFSPDGRYVISGSEDGSAQIWDAASGDRRAALYDFGENDWAVIDPEGRFDASPGGMALMHYVVPKQCGATTAALEAIDLEQLKNRYYEPGLLAKVLGFDKKPLRNVSAFNHVDLYPDVTLLGNVDSTGKLNVKLTNCGGGVGPVQVFVNDKKFIADARGPRPDPNANEVSLAVDLKGAPVIPGRRNEVRIVAWNGQGYVHSRGDTVEYTPSAGASAKGLAVETSESGGTRNQRDLYAIVSGVSNYSKPELHLSFSSKDAESMAKALQLAGDRLFGCGHVHIFLFSSSGQAPGRVPCMTGTSTSADEVSWAAPTKANIHGAFAAAGKATPQDLLVVYLSGHGVAFGDTYAYPTADANTIDPDNLARDSQLLAQTAITSEELADWVNRGVPATHEVMILDTCAAGAAAEKLDQVREAPGDQTRALDRLKDNTGFHLLMGSAADAVSYEASSYGEGLLTYALLEGMKGAALKNDVDVDVVKLFDYAADRVPDLAHGIGGIQRPLPLARRGALSFAIGELNRDDRLRIPLAAPMPVIVAPRFMDTGQLVDDLSLEQAVSSGLRDATDISSRGQSSQDSAVFVQAEEMPGAIRPSGTYTVADGKVMVRLGLFRDGKPIATTIIEGATDDVPALSQKIVGAILDATERSHAD